MSVKSTEKYQKWKYTAGGGGEGGEAGIAIQFSEAAELGEDEVKRGITSTWKYLTEQPFVIIFYLNI